MANASAGGHRSGPERADGRRRWSCDAGSLPYAMLLTLVGLTLSALLMPIVVVQVRSTGASTRAARALHAAQAGLDVALAQILAAAGSTRDVAGNLRGQHSLLPCGTLTGTVGGAARYSVTIDYFNSAPDPPGYLGDDGGYDTAWIRRNALPCRDLRTSHVLLRAAGADGLNAVSTMVQCPNGMRCLHGTYALRTTDENEAGGPIRIFYVDSCLEAGPKDPGPDRRLQMARCTPGEAQQEFAYRSNLTLEWVPSSSKKERDSTEPPEADLCIDAAIPRKSGDFVYLRPCTTTTSPQQQWSFNDNANFQGSTGVALDSWCLNVVLDKQGESPVTLGGCGGPYGSTRTFDPDATVGAGAASAPTSQQLVNLDQFGRCLDVTDRNVDYPHMIAWPCKQSPVPSGVLWNQRFSLPAITSQGSGTGQVVTTKDGQRYCVRRGTSPQRYVKTELCSSVATLDETWTRTVNTGVPETGYRISDPAGEYCLTQTNPDAPSPDLFEDGVKTSRIITAPCDGSRLQKWNAPPNILEAQPLQDIGER